MRTVDVAIIGAGPAGLAASVSVARAGGSVLLVERSPRLGGAATNARVGTICGVSRCGAHLTDIPTFDNPGFASEFARRLGSASGTSLIRNENGLSFLPYNPTAFEAVANDYMRDVSHAVTVVSDARVIQLSRSSARDGFTLELAGQLFSSSALVDCTGDLWAGQQVGAQALLPEHPQAAALVFQLANVPDLDERSTAFLIRKTLRQGALEGRLPERCSYVSTVPGSLRRTQDGIEAAFKLGTAAPSSEESADVIEQRARTDIAALVAFLRSAETSLAHVVCASIAPALGIRSGLRGKGLALLSDDVVRNSLRSADGVALGFWPVERWSTPIKPELIFPEQGDCYEIPLAALTSSDVPGLYFGGKTISASEYAIASARVIGTSLSTGFAAGRAAFGYVRDEPSASVVDYLRSAQVRDS